MWKYIFRKGLRIMTTFILSFKKTMESDSPFSISPSTNYRQHVPKNAEQLMKENWRRTGESLCCAMKKVGEEIESKQE